jgi:hypothetical protein
MMKNQSAIDCVSVDAIKARVEFNYRAAKIEVGEVVVINGVMAGK